MPPADQTASERVSQLFDLGSFTDQGADDPWAVGLNWEDGSPNTSFTRAATGSISTQPHTYDDNGTYTPAVTVTDNNNGSTTGRFNSFVANFSPTATFGATSPVDGRDPFVLSLENATDPSSVDTSACFTYAFDCRTEADTDRSHPRDGRLAQALAGQDACRYLSL